MTKQLILTPKELLKVAVLAGEYLEYFNATTLYADNNVADVVIEPHKYVDQDKIFNELAKKVSEVKYLNTETTNWTPAPEDDPRPGEWKIEIQQQQSDDDTGLPRLNAALLGKYGKQLWNIVDQDTKVSDGSPIIVYVFSIPYYHPYDNQLYDYVVDQLTHIKKTGSMDFDIALPEVQ